nr:GNAT family N-acetyltransferase [Candidatus Woesebacteria bacterium]
VTFLYNGMEIATLWVDEKARGQGLGQKLMEMAEAEGKKRGATFAYTNTFTWQAPGFYEKIGYQLYGKLDDFPVGNTLSYYRKDLN